MITFLIIWVLSGLISHYLLDLAYDIRIYQVNKNHKHLENKNYEIYLWAVIGGLFWFTFCIKELFDLTVNKPLYKYLTMPFYCKKWVEKKYKNN